MAMELAEIRGLFEGEKPHLTPQEVKAYLAEKVEEDQMTSKIVRNILTERQYLDRELRTLKMVYFIKLLDEL